MMPIMVCSFLLEARAYNEDDTSEKDIEAILSRISLLEDGILQYVELPIMTVFSTNLLFDELERYVENHEIRALYFDLTSVQVPQGVIRKLIIRRFEPIVPKVPIMAFVTGKRPLINITIRFIVNVSGSVFTEAMFVETKEKALADIHEQLSKK